MYVCLLVCLSVCTYECMYACMYVCMCVHVWAIRKEGRLVGLVGTVAS